MERPPNGGAHPPGVVQATLLPAHGAAGGVRLRKRPIVRNSPIRVTSHPSGDDEAEAVNGDHGDKR